MVEHPIIPRLLLITDRHLTHNLAPSISQAVAGGVDHVLLREKELDDPQFSLLAHTLLHALAGSAARLLISGRPHLAKSLGAAGVHLPQKGPSVARTRIILGDSMLLGCSCHDEPSAKQAFDEGADYVTLSPVFPTQSHPQAPPLGLKKFAEIRHRLPGPVLALGGITSENVKQTMTSGAFGIALIRGILDKKNPQSHAEIISSLIKNFIE